MSIALWIVGAALVLAAVSLLAHRRRRLGEARLVVCPDSQEFESVRLKPGMSPRSWFTDDATHRLSECSRWPEACDCEQECRRQLENSSAACRVHSFLDAYYGGRVCALCGVDVSDWSPWAGQSPGLRTPDGRAFSWEEIPLRELPAHLEVDEPLCWNCSVIERVCADNPERITERPHREEARAKRTEN
jgi:hypothetical protein